MFHNIKNFGWKNVYSLFQLFVKSFWFSNHNWQKLISIRALIIFNWKFVSTSNQKWNLLNKMSNVKCQNYSFVIEEKKLIFDNLKYGRWLFQNLFNSNFLRRIYNNLFIVYIFFIFSPHFIFYTFLFALLR